MIFSQYFSFSGVTLEPIRDSDIDETVGLINPAYSYQEKAKGAPRTNPLHLRERASETDFYVARSGGEIVGCVYLAPKNSALHFGLLTVADRYRKTGLAQAIMQAIEKFAIQNHYKSLGLDYMSLAPWLRSYYEKYGFRETGRVTKWGTIDLIQMSKEL